MALLGIIGFLVVLAAIYGPQYWVGHTMRRHSAERQDFPGTGGEMAQHLVERFELKGVGVEATDGGDHYDPEARVVRLSQANYNGASLTAVAVAAHEVGHALQHHRGERGLALRQSLAGLAMATDKVASVFFIAAPVLAILLRSPLAMFGMALIGIGLLDLSVVAYLEQTRGAIGTANFALGFVKSITFGLLVAAVGCRCGLAAGRSAADVGKAATDAVVISIVGIILLDAVFAVCANALDI